MNLGKFIPPIVSETWARVISRSLAGFAQAFSRGDDLVDGQVNRMALPYVQSPWVFAAINLVSGEFTGLSVKFYTGDNEHDDPVLAAWWTAPALGNDRKPIARGDVDKLLALNMQLWGEFFILLDDSWAVAGLRRNPASTARFIIARPDRIRLIIQGGELQGYEYIDAGGRRSVWLPEQVIHKMEPNPYDDWRGLGRAQVARVAIEGVFLTGTYIRDLMRNNGDQGMIVIGKNGVANDAQREQIVADLRAKRAALRAGIAKDLFLTGEITVDRPPEQAAGADLTTTKGLSQQEIFIAFCVPPSMSTVKQSYSIGKDSDRYQLVTGTSQPLAKQICAAYAELATRQTGKVLTARHNWDDHPVMQEVRNSRIEAALKLWSTGWPWSKINDYLGLGMKPFPGWDIPYLPFSVVAVDTGGQPVDSPTTSPALDETAAPVDDQVKHLQLLLLARSRATTERKAPAAACACGCAPLDALLAQVDKDRDPAEIAIWRDHMRQRREQVKGFESRFRASLFKARTETIAKILAAESKTLSSQPSALSTKGAATDFLFNLASFTSGFMEGMRKQQKLALDAAGKQVFLELGKDDPFEFAPADVLQFVQDRENKLRDVPQTVFDRIRAELQAGLDAGDSTKDLADRVRAEFNAIDKGRSQVIAQTEVAAAYGYGRNEAMQKAGVARKAWLTSGNANVRDTHRQAGQDYTRDNAIALDAPFIVGGQELMFPGDPSGSPEEVINCHCIQIAVAD